MLWRNGDRFSSLLRYAYCSTFREKYKMPTQSILVQVNGPYSKGGCDYLRHPTEINEREVQPKYLSS